MADEPNNQQTPDPGAGAAPSSPDTVLTGTAPDGGTGTTSATPDGGAAPAGAPEKYEFTAPEGTTLDTELVAKYEPIFRDMNLTNEAAQKLINQYAADKLSDAKSFDQRLLEQHEGWLSTVKADEELGGAKFADTSKFAQAAVAKFGTPELKTYLTVTGLGSHPELVRAFARVGRAMSEDSFVQGGANAAKDDSPEAAALRVFPSMKK